MTAKVKVSALEPLVYPSDGTRPGDYLLWAGRLAMFVEGERFCIGASTTVEAAILDRADTLNHIPSRYARIAMLRWMDAVMRDMNARCVSNTTRIQNLAMNFARFITNEEAYHKEVPAEVWQWAAAVFARLPTHDHTRSPLEALAWFYADMASDWTHAPLALVRGVYNYGGSLNMDEHMNRLAETIRSA